MSEIQRGITPKYIQRDLIELINENKKWNAMHCHSYMIKNVGNTNCTINSIKVLRPGEWFSSSTDNPDIVNGTELRFEFDKTSPVQDGILYPGSTPQFPNIPFDPTLSNIAKNDNIEIIKSYLEPYTNL